MMQTLVQELCNAGIELELMPDGCIAVDAGLLNDTQRQAIRAHKHELVEFLLQTKAETEAVLLDFFDMDAPWRPFARAYQQHANTCPHCAAAGQGYGQRCAGGMALWSDYQQSIDAEMRGAHGK